MRKNTAMGVRHALALLVTGALVAGCGDYGGGDDAAAGGSAAGSNNNAAFAAATQGTADQVRAFSSTVQPMLRSYCADCHAGAGPGTPHIAHPDADTAYHAVVDNGKVDFGSPDRSRLVRRLVVDFHHCWNDCAADGAEMETAIAAWADAIRQSAGGGTPVARIESGALRLDQGVEDTGADRHRGGLVAFWEFREGAGTLARDTSGVAPAMDLTLSGRVSWLPNYGLEFERGKAQAPASTSRKLFDRIAAANGGTQQYSVEAWVFPAEIDQDGPARILSYSEGTTQRNFTLGQVQYSYDFRNRSLANGVDANGAPSLETDPDEQDLQDVLQHVVITYDQYRGRRIYVNGEFTDDVDAQGPSRLWNWDPSMPFVLGNETSNDRPWEGRIRLAAVYEHALTGAQIRKNRDAGVGKRLVMRFDVSAFAGPGSYVEMEASEFDAFSYLFCRPTLVNGAGARVAGMRIAVNGVVAVSGQAFASLDTVAGGSRHELSSQCSLISKDLGPLQDVFTLDFEYLGPFQNPRVAGPPPPLVIPIDPAARPDTGLRTFLRANETFATVTGVDPNTANVQAAFALLEQQLPTDTDLRTFVSAQQMALANLSLEYCDSLVESPGLRDAFFGTNPAFQWDQPATVAFDTPAKRDVLLGALHRNVYGANLAVQPSQAELTSVLDPLIDTLIAGCDPVTCDATRTRTVVKAVCAAALSSAAVTVH